MKQDEKLAIQTVSKMVRAVQNTDASIQRKISAYWEAVKREIEIEDICSNKEVHPIIVEAERMSAKVEKEIIETTLKNKGEPKWILTNTK